MDFFRKIFQKEGTSFSEKAKKIDAGWRIEIIEGQNTEKYFDLDYSYIKLGRKDISKKDEPENSIRFQDQSVHYDQAHLKWYPEKEKFTITHDKRSGAYINFTYINNKQIDTGKEIFLDDNDIVKMGNMSFRIIKQLSMSEKKVQEAEDNLNLPNQGNRSEGNEEKRKVDDESSEATVEGVYTGYSLNVIDGPDTGLEYPVSSDKVLVGRNKKLKENSENGFFLSDKKVSRNHVQLIWDKDDELLKIVRMKKAKDAFIFRESGEIPLNTLDPDRMETLLKNDVIILGETYIKVDYQSREDRIKSILKKQEIKAENPSLNQHSLPSDMDNGFPLEGSGESSVINQDMQGVTKNDVSIVMEERKNISHKKTGDWKKKIVQEIKFLLPESGATYQGEITGADKGASETDVDENIKKSDFMKISEKNDEDSESEECLQKESTRETLGL